MPISVDGIPEVAVPKGWTFDKRQVIGAALGLLCIGILVGFKLGTGSEPLVIEKPIFVKSGAPCADCEERARESHPATGPVDSVPGDSSVPED
jgi:hypothetical protein